MDLDGDMIVDREAFNALRRQIGADFGRIIGYFREDGIKSIRLIEDAMRNLNAAALVRPAHTLKGESLQFGAEPLGTTAERIERAARDAVEMHDFPHDIADEVAKLRPLFQETLAFFDKEVPPAVVAAASVRRAGGFGRKIG
ncbi:HPt (histidine-containing phosphotransfer) domain-containing protein [Sphingomonas vulcanisoli]|uniref:HPt (Histidine-containing phosphotransfer) domain-containing protein n=1 Tax=Sphingomonas vulcanisoli TaxID=1658060 RepID=A0ABX0TYZ4_9SPHN|nr:Hpt domain-containing protein [Sphingomonas vulcanisoli]NIJ08861.1 HPt (histidine-containing phosphotransfer) domain-containing protein [Sphingomonas vulcanisoli]